MNAASRDGAANSREGNTNKTSLLPNAVIDQVRAPLFINADHILPAVRGGGRWVSYTTERTRRKSALQFRLEFISVCRVQFVRGIAAVPRHICRSLLVKRHG